MAGQLLVQVHPRARQTIGGEVGQLRPGHEQVVAAVELGVAAVDAQAFVAMEAVGLGDVDAEPDQRADGAGSEAVAADLVAREGRLLQQDDVETASGEVRSSGRSTRTGPDDHHVGSLRHSSSPVRFHVAPVGAQCTGVEPGHWAGV